MIHTDGRPTIAHKAADAILEGERLGREIPPLVDNLTTFDFHVQNEGSLVILHPQNDAARAWIDAHIYEGENASEPLLWWCGGVVIEPRYVTDVIDGILSDGLTADGA